MWTGRWWCWIGSRLTVPVSWREPIWLLLIWMTWALDELWNPPGVWMLLSPPPSLHSGLCHCVAPPLHWFLHRGEALHLGAERSALPHHGSHEDSGGHALCFVRTQKHTQWVQRSSQVRTKVFLLWRHQGAGENIPRLFPLLQSSEHDAKRSGTPFWTDGGRVSDQRCADNPTADEGVGDAEDPQGKFPPRAAVEVQESFSDGHQTRRRGTLRRSAPGGGLLRNAQRVLQLAGGAENVLQPQNLRLLCYKTKNKTMVILIPLCLDWKCIFTHLVFHCLRQKRQNCVYWKSWNKAYRCSKTKCILFKYKNPTSQ